MGSTRDAVAPTSRAGASDFDLAEKENCERNHGQLSAGKLRGVCVVTDDVALAHGVERSLSSSMDADLHQIPLADWSAETLASESDGCYLLDLRSDSAWRKLDELWSNGAGSRGGAGSLFGLVEHGVPSERAILADHALLGIARWPWAGGDGLAAMIGAPSRAQEALRANWNDGYRTVRGRDSEFRTYTPSLFPVIEQIGVAARHDYNVLLMGETGTGKTTLAKIIHDLSPRAGRECLRVSCGALPNELMSSELFGHVRGAFTGADRTKVGKFEVADGGTIVLEEIDTLDMLQQAKLLRVLETGEFEPLGSNDTRTVKTRVVATSNVDLERLVAEKCFRADLYFRLKQFRFDLPPLRSRPRDIVWLIVSMVEECCSKNDLSPPRIDPLAVDLLKAYRWPGNIRELRNEVHCAVLYCRDSVLQPRSFSADLIREAERARDEADSVRPASELATQVAHSEVEVIERMLKATDFNRSAAARALGISRVTLYNKIRKYNIKLNGGAKSRG